MKKLLSVITLCALCVTAKSQIVGAPLDTNVVTKVSTVLGFLSSAETNLAFSAYGLYDMTTKTAGGGVAADYSISPYVGAALRMDYLKGDVYMPQGTVALQLPLTFGKVTVVPFTFAGIGTSLSGKGPSNGELVYVASLGVSTHITKNLSLLVGIERWTGGGFNDNVLGFGARWKF